MWNYFGNEERIMRDVCKKNGICFDFHIHSIYSGDSILYPKDIIRIAKKRGLAGVAVTDHNSISGGIKTKSLASDDFMVVIGSEIKTNSGDIIGLFLNENIKAKSIEEVCEEIKDQGGISVLPHPFKNHQPNVEELIKFVDMVEVLNARIPNVLNIKARTLAKKFKCPCIAGSDAHTPFEIGNAIIEFPEKQTIVDSEDIRKCLFDSSINIRGNESKKYIQLLSVFIGKYKRDGILGITKSGIKKVLNRGT